MSSKTKKVKLSEIPHVNEELLLENSDAKTDFRNAIKEFCQLHNISYKGSIMLNVNKAIKKESLKTINRNFYEVYLSSTHIKRKDYYEIIISINQNSPFEFIDLMTKILVSIWDELRKISQFWNKISKISIELK